MRSLNRTIWMVALALAVPMLCSADPRGTVVAGISGGAAFPVGDLGDVAVRGFTVGGTFDYLATEHLALGLTVNVSRLKMSGSLGTLGSGSRLGLAQIGPHVRWFFGDMSRLCLYAGAGVAGYDITVDHSPNSDQRIGANGSLGVSLPATRHIRLRLEGTFHEIATRNEPTQYAGAAATVMFKGGESWNH